MPRIAVLVSNDLEHDQRVAKVCAWLHSQGFEITLAGRMGPHSKPIHRPYAVRRFQLLFTRGALFYAALNIRLFFFLLFRKVDVILANDLDTLLPAFLISRIRGKALVYDSHEYFTEAEGLTGRAFQKNVWLSIERWIFPRLTRVYTVNDSIAAIYRNTYGVDVKVVRNIPLLAPASGTKSKKELGIPEDRYILILQGAYIDPDRGGPELIEAMTMLEDCHLLLIGTGRDMQAIRDAIVRFHLQDRVTLLPRMPYDELRAYTGHADIGLSLDKPVHLNYTYSLPNKLFDYLHAGVPVLVSDLPELRRIVEKYHVGQMLPEVTSEAIAKEVRKMLDSPERGQWKRNTIKAREELNWQRETEVLREAYGRL